jgi:hypothetical protein
MFNPLCNLFWVRNREYKTGGKQAVLHDSFDVLYIFPACGFLQRNDFP